MLEYMTIAELTCAAREQGKKLSEVVLADQSAQMEIKAEELYARMERSLDVMQEAIKAGMDPDLRSTSGLTGGDAARMQSYAEQGGMTGSFLNKAMARAIAVAEYNAAMGKIVAAPTAGSCGIIPGTVLSMLEEGRCTREQAVMSLFTSGAVGIVIANKACLAGAQGGCQAECGSAAAMAAAALVHLQGGSAHQMAHACAMAVKNLLGLVCDPVGGLVEVPCVKRNVIGAMNAVSAADMALAGIESRIPVDEVIDAMGDVGRRMPVEFRETALGGLAATPTGREVKRRMAQQ